MNKQHWIKLCAAGVAAIGLTVYATGLFAGEERIYGIPKIDPRAQDGTYSAQKTNNFSTVRVDMTIEKRAIKDCKITSFGEGDLMTDEIRTAWGDAVVESQDIAPDAITGATLTFSAASAREAMEDIMAQAVGEKEPEPIEDPVPARPAETEPQEETPVPAEPAAAEELPETDPMRLMRERPVFTEPEAPAAETEPEPAAAEALPETDPMSLMRERPVFTEPEAPAAETEPASAAPAEAEALPETDPMSLMRERPVFTEPEAPAESEAAEAPAEPDATRLMRRRPNF